AGDRGALEPPAAGGGAAAEVRRAVPGVRPVCRGTRVQAGGWWPRGLTAVGPERVDIIAVRSQSWRPGRSSPELHRRAVARRRRGAAGGRPAATRRGPDRVPAPGRPAAFRRVLA